MKQSCRWCYANRCDYMAQGCICFCHHSIHNQDRVSPQERTFLEAYKAWTNVNAAGLRVQFSPFTLWGKEGLWVWCYPEANRPRQEALWYR